MTAELKQRKNEGLKLYRPTEQQQKIHECRASEILVIGGNRSGKSMCTFAEDARAATGQDPYGKYPKTDGILVIIGKDWRHIGLVVYKALFAPGAFKIIRDEDTKEWRAFDPKKDADRKSECRPAPPLIPERMIKSTSWVLKSASYIQKCTLHNGWQIYFFSSEGEPPQGFAASRVHIDEDINSEAWVPEMQARLMDKKGVLCWSAMPHSANNALLGLKERADSSEEQFGEESPIRQFKLKMLDNPHLDDEEKAKSIARWSAAGDDVLRQRADGDFITDSILMYPNFDMRIHGMERTGLKDGQVPRDWARYAVVDPGHSVTAVLFVAVPPDESMWLCYDQLYLRNCNAEIFGRNFHQKVMDYSFYAFIIDAHGARIRDIGSGRLPSEQYTEQLVKRGVRSETTGASFLAGCDDIPARTEATRVALHIQPNGQPQLKVLESAVPDLEREMKRYRKRVNYVAGTAIVTDMPNTRGECHIVQCLEYLCAYRPRWHKPVVKDKAEEPWWWKWQQSREKRRRREQAPYINLGPSRNETQ